MLTINGDNAARDYGAANPALTGSLVGLQAGDNITATFSTTATSQSNVGTYAIGGQDDGSDHIMALVMTGTASRPTGVFRGHSGYLIITSATDNVLRGRFEVDATGFLASDPENEGRPIRATGMFTATSQYALLLRGAGPSCAVRPRTGGRSGPVPGSRAQVADSAWHR